MSPFFLKIAEAFPGFGAAFGLLCFVTGEKISEMTPKMLLLAAIAFVAQRFGRLFDRLVYDPLFGHGRLNKKLDELRDHVSIKLFGVPYSEAREQQLISVSSRKTTLYKRCAAIGGDGAPGFAWRLAVSKAARTLLVIFIFGSTILAFLRVEAPFFSSQVLAFLNQSSSQYVLLATSLVLLIIYLGFMYSQHVLLYEAVLEKAVCRTLETGKKEWWIPKEGTTTGP